jgi:hypothetical protein
MPSLAHDSSGPTSVRKTVFSFVVDRHPKFASMGYQLALSLRQHSCDNPADIHVQFTESVPDEARRSFEALGCTTHQIKPFGDGRFCNKLAQLGNLKGRDFSIVVLLDTDMIALDDLRPHLSNTELTAKVVDGPNPPLSVLRQVARLAGMREEPQLIEVDASSGLGLVASSDGGKRAAHESPDKRAGRASMPAMIHLLRKPLMALRERVGSTRRHAGQDLTFVGNCNGGMYGIPKHLVEQVDTAWRYWALWLLQNIEPLKKARKQTHVDQVAMWLAIHMGQIPFRHAPSNANYYLHFAGPHRWFDERSSIALLHYHDSAVDTATGRLKAPPGASAMEQAALSAANAQIDRSGRSAAWV